MQHEIEEFLKDSVGCVEATSFEQQCLWEKNQKGWTEVLGGYGKEIGELDGRPVVISLRVAIIFDQRVIFYHPTSQVVDWGMIVNWLDKNMPWSAKVNGQLRNVDAQNFHVIRHYAMRLKDAA